MSRRLALALVLAGGVANADDAVTKSETPPDMSQQGIGAEIGAAIGGRVTPGGLRLAGHYLYQLSDRTTSTARRRSPTAAAARAAFAIA